MRFGRRQFRARLQRVASALDTAEQRRENRAPFDIDPKSARQLVADNERLSALVARVPPKPLTPFNVKGKHSLGERSKLRRFYHLSRWKEVSLEPNLPYSLAELEEIATLKSSISQQLETLAPVMKGYGLPDWRRDVDWQVYRAPEDETWQRAARSIFFRATPEGKARERIAKLEKNKLKLDPTHQAELDDLQARFPDVPWDDTTMVGRFKLIAEESRAQRAEATEIERLQSIERQKAREERRKREAS